MKHYISIISRSVAMPRLLLVCLLALNATTSMARTYYRVYFGTTQITSDNCADITCPEIKSGKVSYDPATHTLTLSNAVISVTNDYCVRNHETESDFTIRLEGTNSITISQDDKYYYAAISSRSPCTITGTGSLETNYPISMNATDLTITGGCKITASCLTVNSYFGDGCLTISGADTQVTLSDTQDNYSAISVFESVTLNDGLKIVSPEGGYYDTANRRLVDSSGQRSTTAYIARTTKKEEYNLWVCGVRVTSDNQDNIPVSTGTASYDPYAKKLTLDGVDFSSSWNGDYGISNGNNGWDIAGSALTIDVVSNCTFDCADEGLHLNGGVTTITGNGKLIVKSGQEAAAWMADGSTLNLEDANVRLTSSSKAAIQGQSWWKTEIVNVNHSRLEAYSPTYTTDQISELNLVRSRFADVGSRSGTLFGFDATQGGSVTYEEAAYQGRFIIEPYELYYYDIFLDATQINSDNMHDPKGDGAFSYDPESNTLTWKKSVNYKIQSYNDGLTLLVADDVSQSAPSAFITAYDDMTITGPGKLTSEGYIWGYEAQITIADANVVFNDGVGANGKPSDRLVLKNATVSASQVSAFGGGITLEGCTITSPKGASVKDGSVVDADGNIVTTGVTIGQPTAKKGDVNDDGSVDVADISTVIDVMAGKAAERKAAADVNADNSVDVADISTIIDIMAGKDGDTGQEVKAYTQCPDANHPHMIDLGLPSGTKWACCNVGATAPGEYGNYCTFDEAQAFNPPSLDQIKELIDNTTSEWTAQNGVNGYKFTGANGGSVFLPAAGLVWDGRLYYVGSYGDYWSSSPYGEYGAYYLYFGSGGAHWSFNGRGHGFTVRPVR